MPPFDALRPDRSTDPNDYQALPRPLAAMAKPFPSGFEIAPHEHARDQLLYAVAGVMHIETETEAWIVPPDRAVYLPARTRHRVVIRGDLEMRTLYIAAAEPAGLPQRPTVIEVSELLRALILALIDEPVLYDDAGRADRAAHFGGAGVGATIAASGTDADRPASAPALRRAARQPGK